MANLDMVRQKLIEANYYIECNLEDNNVCYLRTPATAQYKPTLTRYTLNNTSVVAESLEDAKVVDVHKIKGPTYSIREILSCDIITMCTFLKYNPALVIFKVKNQPLSEVEFLNTIKLTLKGADKQKDVYLRNLLVPTILMSMSRAELLEIAEKYQIVDGYQKCLEVLGHNDGDGSTDNSTISGIG